MTFKYSEETIRFGKKLAKAKNVGDVVGSMPDFVESFTDTTALRLDGIEMQIMFRYFSVKIAHLVLVDAIVECGKDLSEFIKLSNKIHRSYSLKKTREELEDTCSEFSSMCSYLFLKEEE